MPKHEGPEAGAGEFAEDSGFPRLHRDPAPAEEPHGPRIDRSLFGGTERRQEGTDDTRAPITSTELKKGPTDLVEEDKPRVNWRVFIISAAIILAFSVWAMLMPDHAKATMLTVVTWISTNLG